MVTDDGNAKLKYPEIWCISDIIGLEEFVTSQDALDVDVEDEVINATVGDIQALADVVEKTMAQGYLCVIGNEDKIQEQKDMFQEVKPLFA